MPPKSEKKNSNVSTSLARGSKPSENIPKIRRFTVEEIADITRNFHKDNLCGEGEFAVVYKGLWHYEEVAVKMYTKDHANLAQNEFDAYSALGSCANIVPLKGICFDDNFTLVMKFVPRNLKQVLAEDEGRKNELIKWTDTLTLLKQLANAIKSVIDKDYVIGDVKPDNILVDKDGKVFLCDLGSARKGGVGLPTRNEEYSPNEVKKSGNGTSKTDVFSYGVILLQMIMKVNIFPKLDEPIQVAMLKTGNKTGGRKKKKDPNSSKKLEVHVSVEARAKEIVKGHAVNKKLIQSGCNPEDAKKITALGIECTNEEPNQRPAIEHVISVLEELQVKKMKA